VPSSASQPGRSGHAAAGRRTRAPQRERRRRGRDHDRLQRNRSLEWAASRGGRPRGARARRSATRRAHAAPTCSGRPPRHISSRPHSATRASSTSSSVVARPCPRHGRPSASSNSGSASRMGATHPSVRPDPRRFVVVTTRRGQPGRPVPPVGDPLGPNHVPLAIKESGCSRQGAPLCPWCTARSASHPASGRRSGGRGSLPSRTDVSRRSSSRPRSHRGSRLRFSDHLRGLPSCAVGNAALGKIGGQPLLRQVWLSPAGRVATDVDQGHDAGRRQQRGELIGRARAVTDGSNDRPTLNRIGGGARQGDCSGRRRGPEPRRRA